jgi:CMP-N-acetylneuraminic acid synthetase
MMRLLGGKTLVQRAVEAVLASDCFDRVIVSSDSEAILETILGYPVEARYRPDHLATDTATTMDVLRDLLSEPQRHPLHAGSGAIEPPASAVAVVALCQPTTPFRTAEDIRSTAALLTGEADAAIAVSSVPVPPQRSFAMSAAGKCLIPERSPLIQGVTRKQAFDELFTPNGAAYVSPAANVMQHGSFFAGNVFGHVMPRERSVDIDDEIDWQLAEILLGRQP